MSSVCAGSLSDALGPAPDRAPAIAPPSPAVARERPAPPMRATGGGSGWKIGAALAASFAIHAGFLILPLLGVGAPASGVAWRTTGLPQAALTARLSKRPVANPDAAEIQTPPGPTARLEPSAPQPPAVVDNVATPQHDGAGLLPIEGDNFYPSVQLTERPVALAELALDYRAVGPIVGSGKMIMTLWITAQGEVEKAEIDESELPAPFAGPAIDAFKRMRFKPGELHGRSVGTVMKIELTLEDERAPALPPVRKFAGDAAATP